MNKVNMMLMYLVLTLTILIPINMGIAFGTDDFNSAEDLSSTAQTNEEVRSDCAIISPNVKDSLILSIATLCLPGIVEKLYQLQSIKCEKITCRYNAAINGLDENVCSVKAKYSKCKYVYGEFFSLFGMNILTKIRDLVKTAIANPIGLAFGIGTAILRKHVSNCASTGSCNGDWVNIEAGLLSVIDAVAAIGTFTDMIKNGVDLSPSNTCDDIPDIKKELEEIVNDQEKDDEESTVGDVGGDLTEDNDGSTDGSAGTSI